MLRIERARVPQGLIRNAKTYCIVLNEKGLYLLHVGPSHGMVVRPKNVVEKAAINFALDRVERKISEGEQRLAQSSIDDWAAQKKSAFYLRNTIESAKMDTNYAGEPRLTIIAGRKKWKFMIPPSDVETANELASRLAS